MAKKQTKPVHLKVSFMRDVLDQHFRDEISYSRMVELINEEANRQVKCDHILKKMELLK